MDLASSDNGTKMLEAMMRIDEERQDAKLKELYERARH
jgi:hypothetical protein